MKLLVCLLLLVSTWKPIDSAPHGQVVELCSLYGIAPTYGLYIWHDHKWVDVAEFLKGYMTYYEDGHPDKLRWRPYTGSLDKYIDPTRGAQNGNQYWLGALLHPNYTCKE